GAGSHAEEAPDQRERTVSMSTARVYDVHVTEDGGLFRYRLPSTDGNSRRYGDCEICKQPASEVFIQFELRFYTANLKAGQHGGWTYHKCHTLVGHQHCLLSARRGEYVYTAEFDH